MSSIILEVFDSYFLEVWFAPQLWSLRPQEFGIYLALALPWALFQLLMLKKCRRRWLRLLPLTLAVGALVVAEILCAVLSGWDAILGLLLAVAALYWLLGALAVWGIHLLLRRRENWNAAAEPPAPLPREETADA